MLLIAFLNFYSESCTLGLPKLSILEASLDLSTVETVLHSIFNDETSWDEEVRRNAFDITAK